MNLENTQEKTFEVEKKYILTPKETLTLLNSAILLDQKELNDTYWKTSDMSLPLRDRWLRERAGKWNLKIPTSADLPIDSKSNKYLEVTDTEEIKQKLGIMGISGNFVQDLEEFGYKPWIMCTSIRKTYRVNNFTVVQDFTNFGYEIWEVEKIVSSEDLISQAEQEIILFMESLGIAGPDYVRGKVHEYLFRYKNEEFTLLSKTGIMK